MKRINGIWSQLVSFQHLLEAFRKARLGKRGRLGVGEFELNLEKNLFALQRELQEERYQPGAYRLFTIYERKPRVIAAAPFRDRVVHHAVLSLIEPLCDRTFISDSYACRRGKGVQVLDGAVDDVEGQVGLGGGRAGADEGNFGVRAIPQHVAAAHGPFSQRFRQRGHALTGKNKRRRPIFALQR